MAESSWPLVAAVALALAILVWRPEPAARLGRFRDRARRVDRSRFAQPALLALSALPLGIGLGWWAVPVGAAVGITSHVVLGRLRSAGLTRREEELTRALPQACDLLSVCLASGLPLRTAVGELANAVGGPLGRALGELSATVGLGADETRAWAELARTEPALAPLAREVARTIGSGAALAATLRSLGIEARRRSLAAAQVRARRVGVRSVLPLMICFLPSFLLLGVVPIIGGVAGHLLG